MSQINGYMFYKLPNSVREACEGTEKNPLPTHPIITLTRYSIIHTLLPVQVCQYRIKYSVGSTIIIDTVSMIEELLDHPVQDVLQPLADRRVPRVDLYHEDDIEEVEGTSAGYLQQQRDLLFS